MNMQAPSPAATRFDGVKMAIMQKRFVLRRGTMAELLPHASAARPKWRSRDSASRNSSAPWKALIRPTAASMPATPAG